MTMLEGENRGGPRLTPDLSAANADAGVDAEEPMVAQLRALARELPARIDADPDAIDNGLGKLVLTVVELVRKVLEHQAVRRMDGGSLSDEQVERLGLALLQLDDRMGQLREVFGLTKEELDIDLGPLGRLR